MGLRVQRRIPLAPGVWLNVSLSGVSLSVRRGRVTANSRGGLWVRIARGVGWRS